MSQHARVRSIDALSRLSAAIGVFAEEAEQALIAVDAEMARTQRVVGDEMPRYWQGELRAREENVVRARMALEEALSRAKTGKSTIDERKALARAKQRVEGAQARLAATKRWRRELDREHLLYAGQVEPLTRFARAGAPKACEALRRMVEALEQYVSIEPPLPEEPGGAPPEGPDVRRMGRTSSTRARAEEGDEIELVASRLPDESLIVNALTGSPSDLPPLQLGTDDRRRLGSLASSESPDARQWVLVGETACSDRRVALHRAAPIGPEDSGWRVLGLGESVPGQWRQVPILSILRSKPALHDLLRIGAGWTIVLEPSGSSPIQSVHDPSGTDRWSSIRENPE